MILWKYPFPDIDDCIGVVCQNGGQCQDGINTFTCNCLSGYTGTSCESGKYSIIFTIPQSTHKLIMPIYL